MLKLEAKSCITSWGQLSKWSLHQIKCRKVLSILVTTGKETNIKSMDVIQNQRMSEISKSGIILKTLC